VKDQLILIIFGMQHFEET